MEDYFSFKGRIRRKEFIIKSLILALPVWIIASVRNHTQSEIVLFILLICLITLIVSYLSLIVRRLHDINANGWFSMIAFIPIVNFIFGIFLFFKKGFSGNNKYGIDPFDFHAR